MFGLPASLVVLFLTVFDAAAARSLRVGDFNIKFDSDPPAPGTTLSASTTSSAAGKASVSSSIVLRNRGPRRRQRSIPKSFSKRQTSSEDEQGEQPWSARRGPLVDQILFEDLDIFGLQEVLHNQLEDIRGLLGDNYECHGVGRDDGVEAGEAEPICFRTNMFTLQDLEYFWLSDTPSSPSTSWDNRSIRLATMVSLLDKSANQTLYMLNTQLDNQGADSRLESSKLILQKIEGFINDSDDSALVLLTGDLNSRDTGAAYLTLTNGTYSSSSTSDVYDNSTIPAFLDTADEVVTSPQDASSASDEPSTLQGKFGEKYSNPGFPPHNTNPKTIDYILYLNRGAVKQDWHVTAYGIMPSSINGSVQPSDHRLVVAHFDSMPASTDAGM